MNQRIPVAVLGCTGMVGQKFITLLENHPWFELKELVASERSAGKAYRERGCWKQPTPIPEHIANTRIQSPQEPLQSRILFSGLDANIAGELEEQYAQRGHLVVSNARNHRMRPDVPLIIPEINGSQIELLRKQTTYQHNGGGIVTNPNCSTIILALALYPIWQQFGLQRVMATTLQAISGAGYPGVPTLDLLGNTLPYIAGEEEKMESEIYKILGTNNFKISTTCNRVPVLDGHSICISLQTQQPSTLEGLMHALEHSYADLNLPSSPAQVLQILTDPYHPQPRMDLQAGHGMTVSVGRLRTCPILDWKFTILGHNTIRGAAGAALLNAEWMTSNGLV